MKKLALLLLVFSIILSMLAFGCRADTLSDTEENTEDIVDVPGAVYINTEINITVIINLVPGALGLFTDSACTIPLTDNTVIGEAVIGAVGSDIYHFYALNISDVSLSVELSTGSTPFGNSVVLPYPELTGTSFDLLVGESQELAIIVTVEDTATAGSYPLDIILVVNEVES